MPKTKNRDDMVLTRSQARLIVALHETDLDLSAAAEAVGTTYSNASGKVRTIQHHMGVDVLTLNGLSQLYDAARALVDAWARQGEQAVQGAGR